MILFIVLYGPSFNVHNMSNMFLWIFFLIFTRHGRMTFYTEEKYYNHPNIIVRMCKSESIHFRDRQLKIDNHTCICISRTVSSVALKFIMPIYQRNFLVKILAYFFNVLYWVLAIFRPIRIFILWLLVSLPVQANYLKLPLPNIL